ncbi:MAG: hypothetical protein M3155_04930 [Actinomycetota bacterium]|nr:hypothetical protein [Actinomycetota bacterium]
MPAAAQADGTPWSIGAAQVDTTPPAFDANQDLQDFPPVDPAHQITCPRNVYNGTRLWRFEEPYQDTDHSGDFSYPTSGAPGGAPAPEPFCDYNHNGRWDGIYLSGGVNHLAKSLHDRIDARAVAFSDGSKTVVLESVIAQGIFENYIRAARTEAEALAQQGPHKQSCGHIDEMVVSSNHNESSPDTVGIYGAPQDPTGSFGVNSGIDEYYMQWLDDQIALAAVAACDRRQPASLRAVDFPVPAGLRQEIPNRFPTAADNGGSAAIDPKVRVLQARDASGNPIFTMMNLADHNQDIGQSDNFAVARAVSGDWPGYFHRRLEQDVGGMAMFVAGDLGSMEDLITVPEVSTTDHPECRSDPTNPSSGTTGCYAQVEATGNRIADDVAAALPNATSIPLGAVGGARSEFCIPLENNVFRAAAAAGVFGQRQAYTNCQPTGKTGNELKTSVAVLDVGSQLQFIGNPGEAFPALMLGGPWGVEDASCPNRANPPVPSWHARAQYRFQVGLADDMIGYEKPAWSYPGATTGVITPTDGCTSDQHGHTHHGLEDEGVGPTAGNLVAQNLADILDKAPDPTAAIRVGRYIKADGTLTDPYTAPPDQGGPGHFPKDAVAIWLARPGSTTLDPQPGHPDSGTIVALNGVRSFGSRRVDATAEFMDFDGAPQGGPDLSTRGMLVPGASCVAARFYVDVYPALSGGVGLGPASGAGQAPLTPACPPAAGAAGSPPPATPGTLGSLFGPGGLAGSPPLAITDLRVFPTRFALGLGLPRLARVRLSAGTVISFRVSSAGKVTLAFARAERGRRAGRSCRRPTRRLRRHRSCTRYVAAGSIAVNAHAGLNRVRFYGRLSRRRALRPGNYRLSAVETNQSGRRSAVRSASFALLAPPRRR